DAWRRVFEVEPVRAVICGDDTNQSTRIPLLLARNRGIPSFICHHGALDGRHMIRPQPAAPILAKGKMEEDYLVRVCGVAPGYVDVGAPSHSPAPSSSGSSKAEEPPAIVFFSEGYEVTGGRPKEIYQELLPPLADLALRCSRRLLLKLHPAESRWQRER